MQMCSVCGIAFRSSWQSLPFLWITVNILAYLRMVLASMMDLIRVLVVLDGCNRVELSWVELGQLGWVGSVWFGIVTCTANQSAAACLLRRFLLACSVTITIPVQYWDGCYVGSAGGRYRWRDGGRTGTKEPSLVRYGTVLLVLLAHPSAKGILRSLFPLFTFLWHISVIQ